MGKCHPTHLSFPSTNRLSKSDLAELISEGASHLYTAFTTPPTQPTPRQPTILDQTFPRELLGSPPGRPGPYRYEAPVREPPRLQLPERPPTPAERPLSPLGSIPGGWDVHDEVEEPIAEVEAAVERVDNATEPSIQNVNVASSNLEVGSAERLNDGFGQEARATNPLLPSTINPVLSDVQSNVPLTENDNSDVTSASLSSPRSSAPSHNHTIPLVVEPSSSSAAQLPSGQSVISHQTNGNEDDRISNHSNYNSQGDGSSRPVSPFSHRSTQNNVLHVPAATNNHTSDDHSSVSSIGDASSTKGSPTPKKSKAKRLLSAGRRLFDKAKSRPETPVASGSNQPQPAKFSVPAASSPTLPTTQPHPAAWPTIDTNNPAFVQAIHHGITTFAELNKQLAPLPFLCDLLEPFERLFEAIEMTRTNK